MGGIAGELRFDGKTSRLSTTKAMCDAQIHRGPDEEDYYSNGSVSLGERRFSSDNSSRYHLRNKGHTIHLVIDGEIRSDSAHRSKLQQQDQLESWNSAELLISAYAQWGTQCLHRLTGSFAFALWDETENSLWIARDRFGSKPLHYYMSDNFLAFASEIKPILRHPEVPAKPNANALRQYLRREYATPAAPDTFFAGIDSLLPAHYLRLLPSGVFDRQYYWKPVVSREIGGRISNRIVTMTQEIFLQGIRSTLPSDTSYGVTLSGGIDSSSLVCAIRKLDPSRPIKAFSALFPTQSIDESRYVNIVCEATGAEKYQETITAEEFWNDLPDLLRCQEEPLSMTFGYPQWRLMKRAKEQGVKIMLEGHGGDELLCGYPLYHFYYLMTLFGKRELHKMLNETIRCRDQIWNEAKTLFRTYSPRIGPYLLSLVLRILNYENQPSHKTLESNRVEARSGSIITDLATKLEADMTRDSIPAALDCVDKNSMWHGVEIRTPFLDQKFVEHCISLPLDQKIRDGWTKHAFRIAMKGILPEQIRLRRDKIGFQIPHTSWIDGELRQKLRDFFSDQKLKGTRYYNTQAVRTILNKKRLTIRDANLVWRALNVELWLREFFSETPRSDLK
jgi:asparagine synthase (glutamine-hydrolysing)